MTPNETESALAIAFATRAMSENGLPQNSMPFRVVPNGYSLTPLEGFLPAPTRIKARPSFTAFAGWAEYVNTFKCEDTMILGEANTSGGSIEAALDYHSAESPSWTTHWAVLTLEMGKGFATWIQNSGKWQDQVGLAEFVQDNIHDINDPPAATMLEVVQKLKMTKDIQFDSSVALESGATQFAYIEKVTAKAGDGNLEIPGGFSLGIEVFRHGQRYEVPCRFRYRIEEKKLRLRYDVINPQVIIDDAFKGVMQQIEEATNIRPYHGKFSSGR